MIIRPSIAAGFLYPMDADDLVVDVTQRLLALPTVESKPFGLVVPHGSFDSTGDVSAAAFRHLAKLGPSVSDVIILGAAHDGVTGAVLPISQQFKTPLGNVDVNTRHVRSLSLLPFVHQNDRIHLKALNIEVQLPFLQTCLLDFSMLPVLIGAMNEIDMRTLLLSLPIKENTLLIVSVDVSADIDRCANPQEAFLLNHIEAFLAKQDLQFELAFNPADQSSKVHLNDGAQKQQPNTYKSYIIR